MPRHTSKTLRTSGTVEDRDRARARHRQRRQLAVTKRMRADKSNDRKGMYT